MENKILKHYLSTLKRLIRRILRKIKRILLPSQTDISYKIIVNNSERHLFLKPVRIKQKVKGNSNFVELYGNIESNVPVKTALLNIEFYDGDNKQCEVEQTFSDLNKNENYKCYAYLNKGQFRILASIPAEAKYFVIKIRASSYSYAKLMANTVCNQFKLDLENKFNNIVAQIENTNLNNVNEETISSYFGNLDGQEAISLASNLSKYYQGTNHILEFYFGLEVLKRNKSFNVAKHLKTTLNQKGEMRLLADFIDYVSKLDIPGWKITSERIRDDIEKLENGYTVPENSDSDYEHGDNVFYLLHNSLPYNSGGYATRTHGLLRAINGSENNFNVMGVTRPGYPKDHKKYISKPLPDDIPSSDLINEVTYYRCDQDTKKSSLTLSEYIETYSEQLINLAANKRLGIIHAASNHPNGFAAIMAARKLGICSVYEVRGLWEITRLSRQDGWDKTEQYQFMSKMEAEACLHADRVITITEALKDIMVDRGVPSEKITVVPNCVNVNKFTPFQSKDEKLLKKLRIDVNDVVIGYLGSVVNYEGLDDLVLSAKLLLTSGIRNFKILIVGDGDYLKSIYDSVIENNLQDYVIFTGRVPHEEIDTYYSLVDITPFPRKPYLVCEAVSPLKPFEAMASGKSVIVSSCAALTEIVSHNETGLVFRKGDVTDLAEKLKMLINDPVLRERLAKNGYEWVKVNRDWSVSANIVQDIYKELILEENKND